MSACPRDHGEYSRTMSGCTTSSADPRSVHSVPRGLMAWNRDNKIRNIVFLIFLIRIEPYNTSKIRIIQTRIIRSSTIVDRRDRLVLRVAAMFVFAHVYSIPLCMRPRLSRPARYVRPDYTRGCTCTHRPPYLPIHGVTVERRERTSWRGKRGN